MRLIHRTPIHEKHASIVKIVCLRLSSRFKSSETTFKSINSLIFKILGHYKFYVLDVQQKSSIMCIMRMLISFSNQHLEDQFEELEYYVVYHGKATKAPVVTGEPKFYEFRGIDAATDNSNHWLLQSESYQCSLQLSFRLCCFEIEGFIILISYISKDAFRSQIFCQRKFFLAKTSNYEGCDQYEKELSVTCREMSSRSPLNRYNWKSSQ